MLYMLSGIANYQKRITEIRSILRSLTTFSCHKVNLNALLNFDEMYTFRDGGTPMCVL